MKDKRNVKTPVLTSTYTHKGEFIVCGCEDGSMQVWDSRGRSVHRPSIRIEEAHKENITFIKPFRDPNLIASRSLHLGKEGQSLKLWDLRKASEPIHSWGDSSLFAMNG